MDNFNFNLFKYFYYVVIYNGFTNASNELSVSQSSLSMSIKKLEEELNENLIDRSKKKFRLTEEGRNLFQILEPMFKSLEKNISFITTENKYCEINIGIRFSYAKAILSSFIDEFRYIHPEVKLNIDVYSKLDFDKIKNKEYDIVIDYNDYIRQLENVDIEPLCNLKNYFICGSKLFDEYRNVNSVTDISNCELILCRPSLKKGKFQQFCYDNNISFIETININESDMYFDLIQKNCGIGFSNQLLIKEYIEDKSIIILNIKEKIFEDIFSIAYTKNDELVKEFVSILKKNVEKEIK